MLSEQLPEARLRRRGGAVQGGDAAGDRGAGLEPESGPLRGRGARAADEFDFTERLEELNEELEALNVEARDLEDEIADNVSDILERA